MPKHSSGMTKELPCQPNRWVARARFGDFTCRRNELNKFRAVLLGEMKNPPSIRIRRASEPSPAKVARGSANW